MQIIRDDRLGNENLCKLLGRVNACEIYGNGGLFVLLSVRC